MTRVISLSDRAYEALKSLKKPGESFSDIVLEVTEEKRKSILDFAGKWHGSHEEMNVIFKKVFADRRKSRSRELVH